jgi:DNA-nicking Smr family endonuclease
MSKVHPMHHFLKNYPPPRNGKKAADESLTLQARNIKINGLATERVLDLHGSYIDEALVELDIFILRAVHDGCRKILIIHGKGLHSPNSRGVLKDAVKKALEANIYVRKTGQASPQEGGGGATWAVLKS